MTATDIGKCLFPLFEIDMTEESAQALLGLRASPEVQRRFEEVADRSREGRLSDEEQRQYKLFADTVDTIALLQAQARRVLKKAGRLS